MKIYHSGSRIEGRYEVVQGPREKPSLAGGMELVYLCIDHAEEGRPVALKTFRPELLPDHKARQIKELLLSRFESNEMRLVKAERNS